jgi:broad specificity phosphatase PhoE
VTELFLVRHGESEFNAARRWAGWEHFSPLTALGEVEAQAVADRLAVEDTIAAVYASPLLSAWQTAQIISKALGVAPVPVDGLREVNVGQIGGLTMDEFAAQFPSHYESWRERGNQEFTWPGGENRRQFFMRAGRAVQQIASRHPDDRVVVVCHGGVIRATLLHFFPEEFREWWAFRVHTGSLTRLSVGMNGNRLVALNEYDPPQP